jgi:Terpene synthase family 2, C-terminal metal binding
MSADRVAAMVEAFDAIPPELNPHVEAATRHLNEWVVEHRLIGRDSARDRFYQADFGWFAAVTYPTANEADLGLIADWLAWLFFLDDHLDDGVLGRDPDRAGVFRRTSIDMLNGLRPDPSAPSIVTSLDDLWQRTLPAATPTWRQRFTEHVLAGGVSACWEANNRVRGTVPSEPDYVMHRRNTGAIYMCMDLIDIAEHIDVPAQMYDNEAFAKALEAACDVVCWTNDLYSLDKETSLGEYHNLVTIIQHNRGLEQAEAIGVTADLITERLGEYLDYEPLVRRECVGWTAEVEAYLAGMRSWMRGNLDWSANTRRYRDTLRNNGNQVDYLESMLINRAGEA